MAGDDDLRPAQAVAVGALVGPAQVGADLHGYSVEIETENGETRTFKVPFRGRGGGALGGTGIDAVIKQLESLSPPAR